MTINQPPADSRQHPADTFVAYEYLSVQAPRELESLYQDTYRGFGWMLDGTTLPHSIRPLPLTPAITSASVTLKLKRERGIRNRPLVQELQRRAEKSLAQIARLESSKTSIATAAAIGFGIVGSALLAGSVFSMEGGFLFASIVLGTLGLLLWLGGFVSHRLVKNRRAVKVASLIDREYDLLTETASQASRLLH